MTSTLAIDVESWPLAEAFVISRGAKTEARVVVARLSDGTREGRGECVPYARYGETVESVVATIGAFGPPVSRAALESMPAGAARNALDCALWDLEAKRQGVRVQTLMGLPPLVPVATCYTLSLGTPAEMAAKAQSVAHLKLLKLKLGGAGDAERMVAVRRARPDARLVADANEAWTPEMLPSLLSVASQCGFELIEQPLPAADDGALAGTVRTVPVCADESVHTREGLAELRDRYDAVNIKLDKTGGLTEAVATMASARTLGFKVMVGSMVSTSLAMAPALVLAQSADWADLDSPLLLARDRAHGLSITNGYVAPSGPELWG